MRLEGMCLHEQLSSSALWLSLMQMGEAVVELSFIPNVGEMVQKALQLLRKDSIKLYDSMHLELVSWEARYCVINSFLCYASDAFSYVWVMCSSFPHYCMG